MKTQVRDEIIRRIFSYNARGIKYDLDRMREAAERIGNPQESFRSIHVAGTNGKGSTCAYLDSILRQTGARVGLYTSPHIVDFEERFVIDGKPVAADDWMELFPLIDPLIADLGLTFFEISTLICFELFRRQGVQWAVIETGMGGRLDATNILRPAAGVITSIDMDHMEYLGPDLLSIAVEKLGIVKQGTPLVMIRPTVPAIQRKVRDVCEERAALLAYVDQKLVQEFSMEAGFASVVYDDQRIRLPLAGKHQVFNALCALKTCDVLDIGDRATRKKGVEQTRLPGRFQVVAVDRKTVVFDVGHNPGAARVVADTLRLRFPDRAIAIVAGVMKDKDIRGVLANLAPACTRFVLTQPKTERACAAARLPDFLPSFPVPAYAVVPDVAAAVEAAVGGDESVVCVTGSFFTVGEAMQHLSIKPFG